jgi:hypothetical protein
VTRGDPWDVDWLISHIKYSEGAGDDALVAILARDPGRADSLLKTLAESRHRAVRDWVIWASARVLGDRAVPLLEKLVDDRDPDTRSIARQELEAIDPSFAVTFVPRLYRALSRAKDWYGEPTEAMWRLARLGNKESAPHLLRFAAKFPHGEYGRMMPLVLADYLERPEGIAERIRAHDHTVMFWLVEAATMLDTPGGMAAARELASAPPDEQCAKVFRDPQIAEALDSGVPRL